MLIFSLLVLGISLYLYTVRHFDAPVSPLVRSSLGFFRFLFFCILLYLLLKPQVSETVRVTVTPTLYVAVDDSLSMSYAVSPKPNSGNLQDQSRLQLVTQFLQDEGIIDAWANKGFQQEFSLFSTFSGGAVENAWQNSLPASPQAAHPYTDIASVIRNFNTAAGNDESAYLLLFTDGQWNQGGNPVAANSRIRSDAENAATRIYTFGIGTLDSIFDLALDFVSVPTSIRAGEPLRAQVRAIARGDTIPSNITFRIRVESADGTEVHTQNQTLDFSDEREQGFSIDLPEMEAGEYRVVSEILPLDEELFYENNRFVNGVRVRQAKDRVLALTRAPGWELKFLKRALEDHPAIEVEAYLLQEGTLHQLGDRAWTQKNSGQDEPETSSIQSLDDLAGSLSAWSVIVLHNFAFEESETALAQRLKEFISNGGGVIQIPGLMNTAPLAPAVASELPPPLDRSYAMLPNPVFIPAEYAASSPTLANLTGDRTQNLPPLVPYYQTVQPQAPVPGRSLLEGTIGQDQAVPLVELHRYGLGRVVVFHADSFWQWTMLAEDTPLNVFWLSTIYQARPEILATAGELYTDGFVYAAYEPVRFTYSSREQISDVTASGIAVEVAGPERSERVWLEPSAGRDGMYEGKFTAVEPGAYTAATLAGDASAAFEVSAQYAEINDLRQNVSTLREIAETGGGTYANQPAWKSLADTLPLAARIEEDHRTRFLGEKWWIVTILIAFLTFEWFLRWRQGLP